ncbi:hypothetical protein DS884_07325 [Tenacibaculum sp. E3R01]|uniref:AAA family ATPase n=1 Tax=Tenacibaculum sp. E3R01 TaxID=2267227 RepID=UPI000DEBED25|nr:AAA family ATPase [Tenacibaculum sp. E3R01]RBW59537.1 hypothetical protein DS884_07325 [Tenacibaculum sp. E3R01]
MIKYPRIYSISTVGVIMHYNQDYLLHPIRTDFTGKNGIGKSLIADLLQILFVSDKKKIAFGTESNKKDSRKIETLPYETSDAYVFINIETEQDYFITLGVNIPNKKSRPLRSFWILNQAYGKDDNEELIDLVIHKDNIPFYKDFLIGNTIPPIDKLMIHLREEKRLFLRSFSDKPQKKELYSFLFEKGILPINLALDSNLDAFAKVIQSFSKAKTLDTDSDESLKRFLFDGKMDDIQSEYEKHKKNLEKLITDYKDLETLIDTLENKQEALKNLNALNELYLDTFKEHLCVEYVQIKKDISEKEKRLKKVEKDLSKADETVRILRTGNPRLETQIAQTKKRYQELEQSLEFLNPYKDIFDRIETLKKDIKELDDIVLPPIENEVFIDIPNLENYQTPEIKRRVKEFTILYQKYCSLTGIEDKTELQQQQLEDRKNILSTKKAGLYDLLKLLTKKDKSSFLGQLILQQKTLSPAQETILFKVLQNVKWEKPENVVSGIRYVTDFEFIDKKNIEKDEEHKGYWYNLGGVREFVPETDDKRMFGDIKILKQALKNQEDKINKDITKINKELSEIESFGRGETYNDRLINVDASLDQRIRDFSQFNDLKLTLGLMQNIEYKKETYQLEISKEEKTLSKLEAKINFPIEKKDIAAQIKSLKEKIESLKREEVELSAQHKADKGRLSDKMELITTLKSQPKEYQDTIEKLKIQLTTVTKNFLGFFPDFEFKKIEEKQFINIERTSVFSEFNDKKTNYIGDYKGVINKFPTIENAPEIIEQIEQKTFNFEVIESTLLGPKIKHTQNISEELKQLNSSRYGMFEAIHETMLSIFKQTKGKYNEYRDTVKNLNKFFKGKKISDKYYFQIEFNAPEDFDIKWINELQVSSQQVYKSGELPVGDSVEKFVEDFFIKATPKFNQRIKFSNLLDPKTYFELKTKFTDEFDVEKPDGSTGENYTAIVLLGIGRLSVVLDANRPGLKFLILEEVSNLDSLNFSTFPNIAEEFGYQILTMTPRPFGSDTKQGWYLHHLIEGAGDKNINYPTPNSYFKTNEGREDLEIYLKAQLN